MSDESRKFWKESIGVRSGVRRPAPTGATKAAGSTGAVDTVAPAKEADRPARTEGRSATRPKQAAIAAKSPSTSRQGFDATAEALGRLSIGSSSFARDVEKHLWPKPTPADLRGLAAVAGERHRVPDDERRRLTVSAVGIRARVEGLVRALSRPVLDATILQARAVEWARVARLATETHASLSPRADDESGVDVLEAARGLLPAKEKLEAEARLAAELAATVDAILSGRSKEIISAAAHVPDIEALVAAVRERKLRPGDGLYIEALSAGSFARRMLEENPEEIPLAGRIIRQVIGRFDQVVATTTSAHARDPQSKARLAAWLRFMRDMKSRIDETISRPTDVDTGPVGAASSAPRDSIEDPESERIVVRHLREVRQSALKKGLSTRLPNLPEPEHPDTPTAREEERSAPQGVQPEAGAAPVRARAKRPRARGGSIAPWTAAAGLVLALAMLGIGALLPRFPPPGAVSANEFRAGLSLLEVRANGSLLVATADPTWDTMPSEERRIAAGRLMSVAEAKGFRAGILLDPGGRTLAVWSPGREPELR